MAFDLSKLNDWSDEQHFKVEEDRARAYALATNDDNPRHSSGELAPPVFAVIPIWDAMLGCVTQITPPDVLMQVVHGEQDMFIHKPIVPGMVLRARAAAVGVHVKGSGTTLILKTETRDEADELVNEQYVVNFFRGVTDGEGGGDAAPDHTLPEDIAAGEPAHSITYKIDDDQTFRYAEASGDQMPIHLDDNFAKSVGLPGIIVHGLCTMAFTGRAVVEAVCEGDPTRLRRLAVRFSSPVMPGEEITTRIWDVGTQDDRGAYGFETVNPSGDKVIKNGLAEVAPATS